ncbi:hypothetical protein L0U85_17220 [Glycomyces sp. L485]|uniref:hypothetical protein n=1 Tax=Glycomyces sp. L485 TaxID=2909235 RepID=UPI001F4A2B4E|nr:hypothetical protein [Glycomyces sp. L485]MCH7232580.1 hypothetical protein [Glycomyces sp. L485]
MEATAHSEPPRSPLGHVVGLILGLTLIVGLLTIAFAWPSTSMGPNNVPIAVIGPPEAAAQVADQLDDAEPDGFGVVEAADPAAAVEMIERREVYAALAIGPDGVDLYTATAASPMVARVVTGIADQIAAGMGETAGQPGSVTVDTEDVVALPAEDPNGAGLASSALPMAAGGLIIAALIAVSVRGSGRQAVAAVLAPLAAAAAIAAILRYWLGSVEGDFWTVAGAIALSLLAASWAVLGLTRLLGRPGTIIGAVAIMLVGNPLSGLTSAPELLPAPWGEVGQYLTPGAGATLLRSVSFFDGHGAGTAVVVLCSWLAVGVLMFVIGAVGARVKRVSAVEPEPVAVGA